jgi:hypothetical protein
VRRESPRSRPLCDRAVRGHGMIRLDAPWRADHGAGAALRHSLVLQSAHILGAVKSNPRLT